MCTKLMTYILKSFKSEGIENSLNLLKLFL